MDSGADREVFDAQESSMLGSLFGRDEDVLEEFLDEVEAPEDVSVRVEKIGERQKSQTGVGIWKESDYQVIAEYDSEDLQAIYRGNTATVRNSSHEGIANIGSLEKERREIIEELWDMSDEPVFEVKDILSDTGDRVRKEIRTELPDNFPDEKAEYIWEEALTGRKAFNSVVIGEEGTYTVEDDPDYAFLVDPLDGSSGAVNGLEPWTTTAVTVLDDIEVNGNRVTGDPIGSYIRQINENGAEFSSWDGEASINGEVRFTDLDPEDEIPGKIEGTRIGPIEDNSLPNLAEKRYISIYAGSKGRRPLKDHFLHPIQDQNPERIRTKETGGSYTGASVGWGKTLIAGEPKPTLPTEAAGETFAKAMGAEASDIYGEENDTITVEVGEDGLERTYTAVVAANGDILDETLEAISVEGLENDDAYGDEFETYRDLR